MMVSILAVVSMLCLTVAAAALVLRARRRNIAVPYLENASVSRQWLMQHQSDDCS